MEGLVTVERFHIAFFPWGITVSTPIGERGVTHLTAVCHLRGSDRRAQWEPAKSWRLLLDLFRPITLDGRSSSESPLKELSSL